jgi:hypothetical protein
MGFEGNHVKMTIEEFRIAEREALKREMQLSGLLPFVALNDLDWGMKVPSSMREKHPARVAPLPEAQGKAFVQTCESLHYKSVWIRTDDDEYADRYRSFLNAELGQNLDGIPSEYHVDHLFNRARAKLYGLNFVRMALIPKKINLSHGGGYEKTITEGEAGRGRKDWKHMDEITCMKFLGFLSPLNNQPSRPNTEDYVKFAAKTFGLPEFEIRRNVSELMGKAKSGWAKR